MDAARQLAYTMSMPRRILLVRHCQSQANADGRLEGKGDSPLSEAGREQAMRLAAYMATQAIGPATLIASPLSRARATAEAIGAACGWALSHDPRIREGELGWMEDMSYADVGRHMVERRLSVLDADTHGGESLEIVAARCWEALDEALAATDGPLIAVMHGYAIQALVERRFGHEFGLHRIGNGDIIEVWLEGDEATGPPGHYPLA
jgi:broad specificity phosphatase PhoE